jgi:hypothetical protein
MLSWNQDKRFQIGHQRTGFCCIDEASVLERMTDGPHKGGGFWASTEDRVMSNRRLGTPGACILGLVCLLAACGRPVASTQAVVPRGTSFTIDWGMLTPTRHLAALPVPLAAGAFGNLGVTPATIPFFSSGHNGVTRGLYLADLGARTVYSVPAFGQATAPIGVSPGGQVVGVNDHGRLGVLDLATDLIQVYPQLTGTAVNSASVGAFGSVVFTDDQNEVHLFDTPTGQDFIVPTAGRGLLNVSDVVVSGDGRFVSYTGDTATGTNIFTTDLVTGAQLSPPFLTNLAGPVANLGPSVDGRSLLFTEGDRVRALDLASGFIDNLPLINNHPGVFDAAFFGGDPGRVAFTSDDGQLEIFDRRTGLIDTLPIVNRAFF